MNRTRYAIALATAFGSAALVVAGLDGIAVAGHYVPVCAPASASPPPPVCSPAKPTPPPPVCGPVNPCAPVSRVSHRSLHDHLANVAGHVHEALHHVVHREKAFYTVSQPVPQPCAPAAIPALAPLPATPVELPAK
jgi:hypothetical protein